MKKKSLIGGAIVLLTLCVVNSLSAETITFKFGKTVEGKIIEKTDKYIKIDFYGVPLTYFLDDIESINGQVPVTFLNSQKGTEGKNISESADSSRLSVSPGNSSKPAEQETGGVSSVSEKDGAQEWKDWNGEVKDYLTKTYQLVKQAGQVMSPLRDSVSKGQTGTVAERVSNIQKELKKADDGIGLVLDELDALHPPQELIAYHSITRKAIEYNKSIIAATLEGNSGEAVRYRTAMVKSLRDIFVEQKRVFSKHNAPQEFMELSDKTIKFYDNILINSKVLDSLENKEANQGVNVTLESDKENNKGKVPPLVRNLPFSTAIITYKVSSEVYNGKKIAYIDAINNKVSNETFLEAKLGGTNKKISQRDICDGKTLYHIDLEEKTAPSFAVEKGDAISNIFMEDMYLKYYQGQKSFLGKECKVYSSMPGEEFYLWSGILLRQKVTNHPMGNQFNVINEATDIKLNVPIPDDKFEVPSGIKVMTPEETRKDMEEMIENLKKMGVN